MFFYAQVHQISGVCFAVSSLCAEVLDVNLIAIPSADGAYIGKRWPGTAWEQWDGTAWVPWQ